MSEIVFGDLPTRTYQVANGRVMDKIDELEAMKQLVEKTLTTERFEHVIYTSYFGAELMDLFGNAHSYVATDIKRCIKEALLIDTRVTAIEDFKIVSYDGDIMNIYFVVVTIFGKFVQERRLTFGGDGE